MEAWCFLVSYVFVVWAKTKRLCIYFHVFQIPFFFETYAVVSEKNVTYICQLIAYAKTMYSWVVWLLIVFHQTSSLGVESFSIHSQFIVVYVYHLSISLSFGRSYRLFHGNGLIDRGRWDSRLLLRQTSHWSTGMQVLCRHKLNIYEGRWKIESN